MAGTAHPELAPFVDEVGSEGPVTPVGGRTQWVVGGRPTADAREVHPPTGVVDFEPAELTVRVRAGTPVRDLLDEIGEAGQVVALPAHPGATVGGVLAVGHSDVRRLGRGPIRDTLLELTYVSSEGHLIRAGGPTVKNVTGFDLCRLFVGSLGTLGFAAEVVLRTAPAPEASRWLVGLADPFALLAVLHEPRSVLWDGTQVWVLLEGHTADVEAQSRLGAELGLVPADAGPDLPVHRSSHDPGVLRQVVADSEGPVIAEIGVGVVHRDNPVSPPILAGSSRRLNERVKAAFDPTGRLNPGREPKGV